MGGGVGLEEGAAFFLGGSAILPEILCSGAARWSKGSADPPELSGGTRLGFKGALSNINYAFLVFGWGPASVIIFRKVRFRQKTLQRAI